MSGIAKQIDEEYRLKKMYQCKKCVYWDESKRNCMQGSCINEKKKKT